MICTARLHTRNTPCVRLPCLRSAPPGGDEAAGGCGAGVNARSLRPLHPLRPGVYAVHGKWLGKVEEALDHVIVLWDDGSVCRMLDADPLYLLPHGASALSLAVDGESTYFPGVRVRVETGIRALDCMWLRDAPSRRSGLVYLPAVERVGVEVGVECGMQGVVVSVVAGRTAVRWIASSGEDPGEDAGQPRDVVARNLFPLSAFMHTWCRLALHPTPSTLKPDP